MWTKFNAFLNIKKNFDEQGKPNSYLIFAKLSNVSSIIIAGSTFSEEKLFPWRCHQTV
jgi:hypothetical protein